MVEGGLVGEETGEETVAVGSEANSEDVRCWGGVRGSGVGNDVFHPKREGGYWGIGLVEVVWKVCAAVANCRMKWSVTLHDALYKLRAGRGEGTETL